MNYDNDHIQFTITNYFDSHIKNPYQLSILIHDFSSKEMKQNRLILDQRKRKHKR